MGFVMDGLDAEAYDRQYTDRQLLGRILVARPPARDQHLAFMSVGHSSSLPANQLDRMQP